MTMTTDDEWERPVGLTVEHAISLLDSDDENDSCMEANGEPLVASNTVEVARATVEQIISADNAISGNIPLKRKINDIEMADMVIKDQDNVKYTKINPFAAFAFDASSSSASSSWLPTKMKYSDLTMNRSSTQPKTEQSKQQTKIQIDQNQSTDKEMSVSTDQLIKKWHSFADISASLEQQRFQILVAARLHARCHEKVVLKAMDRLKSHFNQSIHLKEKEGLTVYSLAGANPESEIAPLLSSVLFGNVKAVQIVQAAKDIVSKFGGEVPELECSLRDITGIGPMLASLLAVVNRRCTFSSKVVQE